MKNQADIKVWIDGQLIPSGNAMVSVFDHGFNYGDAIFEGIKFLDHGIFDLKEHVERLYRSASYLQIRIPYNIEDFSSAIVETAKASELNDGYIRVVVSRGAGPLGLRNMDKLSKPTCVIICQPEKAKSPEDLLAAPGRSAKTVSTRRTPPVCMDPRVKSCNYLNNILAELERRATGVDFAVMLDTEGYICEGPAENIFLAQGTRLLTPFAHKCLDGITRRSIMSVAPSLGFTVEERDLTLYDAYAADEMFATGSLNDITWISELDSRQIGTGRVGQVVSRLLPAVRERGFQNAAKFI